MYHLVPQRPLEPRQQLAFTHISDVTKSSGVFGEIPHEVVVGWSSSGGVGGRGSSWFHLEVRTRKERGATCRNGRLGHAPRPPGYLRARRGGSEGAARPVCKIVPSSVRRRRRVEVRRTGPTGTGGDHRTCAEASADSEEPVSKAACCHPRPLAADSPSHSASTSSSSSSRAQVSRSFTVIHQRDRVGSVRPGRQRQLLVDGSVVLATS